MNPKYLLHVMLNTTYVKYILNIKYVLTGEFTCTKFFFLE